MATETKQVDDQMSISWVGKRIKRRTDNTINGYKDKLNFNFSVTSRNCYGRKTTLQGE